MFYLGKKYYTPNVTMGATQMAALRLIMESTQSEVVFPRFAAPFSFTPKKVYVLLKILV
jgi:hypothetical protein